MEDYENRYTIEEFLSLVEESFLIDYDGYGHPVIGGKEHTKIRIYPSDCGRYTGGNESHCLV